VWSGLPEELASGVDAALNWGDGKAYLFRGPDYVSVDVASGTVESELRSIGENWNGTTDHGFDTDLDAAVNDGAGTAYFFKGGDYLTYSVADDKVTATGSIADWAFAVDGSFDSDLDAVVNYGNGRLYVFKGESYVRWDLAGGVTDSEVSGIAENWTGLADAGFGSDLGGSWSVADPAGRASEEVEEPAETAETGQGEPVDQGEPVAPSGPVTGSADPQALAGGADIDAYFTATTGQGFIDWFNAHHADQGAFAATAKRRYAMRTDADTRARFTAFWDTLPIVFDTPTIRLEQFLALQTICINELGGAMAPVSEMFGMAGHPGIAYLFDAIPGLKASYNTGTLSRSVQACFADQGFLDAHASLPYAAELAHTGDAVWAGSAYPADRYPTGITEAGAIAQADFRGRGMIQTTWRSGYLPLIDFVQAYTGGDATVLDAQSRWSGLTRDQVAYASTNADWDALFQQSSYVVPAAGVRSHSQGAGGYLDIATDPGVRHGKERGSYAFMGQRISGSASYGALFSQRCQQLRAALP
jgi:hypothetical protein